MPIICSRGKEMNTKEGEDRDGNMKSPSKDGGSFLLGPQHYEKYGGTNNYAG